LKSREYLIELLLIPCFH